MFGGQLTSWKMDEKCRLSPVRQTKLTYVGFRAHVKIASRIVKAKTCKKEQFSMFMLYFESNQDRQM